MYSPTDRPQDEALGAGLMTPPEDEALGAGLMTPPECLTGVSDFRTVS
jgi:hypothetical protein